MRVFPEHIWPVTVKPKGLGNGKVITPTAYRLCLTDQTLSLIRPHEDKSHIVFQVCSTLWIIATSLWKSILNLDSIDYSVCWGNTNDVLSPGHTVLWLPPHLIQAQVCPFFLQDTRSSGSLHISFKLSPDHSFSRPHGPLAPSTSHSNSALSILSPGHTVLWLPPHLIQTRPCPFFLQATRSSGSLHISFKLSPVHSFSRPHGPLAPSTSHSNSALSILSPGHTVFWLPPHLIQTQPCPFFLQATRSSGSLHTSFKLGPVHSFSRPHGPLAPSTSHSNLALSILSPGHMVLWLPPHLNRTQPCPFFHIVEPLSCWPSSWSFPINFILQDRVWQGSLCSYHMSKPFDLHSNSSNVSYFRMCSWFFDVSLPGSFKMQY